jgi:uncharacterized protein (TIRG00374 family)
VAKRVDVGPPQQKLSERDAPTVMGEVVSYQPGQSLVIQDAGGQEVHFDLVKSDWSLFKFKFVKTAAQIDGTAADGTIPSGTVVSVWEHPSRGLAYVWRRHVLEGQPIHWGYFALAFAIGLVAIVLTFLRWYVLVRAQDLPFTVPDALRLGFIGFFFNSVMPGAVGGDIIKAAFLAREKRDRKTVAVATVIMDRAIALWALVWFVAIAGAIFWASGALEGRGAHQSLVIVRAAGITVAVSFTAWMLLGLLPAWRAEKFAGRLSRIPKAGHTLAEFWRSVWMYRCRQASVAATMLISWVGHVGFVLYFYCSVLVLWDAGDPAERIPTLAQHFLLVPIGLVIQAVPLFPGGAGIGELGFGVLYGWLGASVACGVLGSLVFRVLQWVLGIFGYFVYRHLRTQIPVADSNGAGRNMTAEEAPVAVG